MRPIILAACLLCAGPAIAQDPKGAGNDLQERRPLSDQVPGTPSGDLLTSPARGPVPSGAPRQEGIPAGEDAATNARTLTEDTPVIEPDDDVDTVRTTPDPDPRRAQAQSAVTQPEPPRHAEQFRGDRPIGPNAGSATGGGRVYAEDLKDYTVHLSDREQFGRVARVVIDLESGRLQGLEVSTGGLLGVGDQRFDIPWEAVAAVNTGTKELRVAVSEQQIQGQKEAFDRPAGDRQ